MATLVRTRMRDGEWLARGIVSGSIATVAMGLAIIVGFYIARNFGSSGSGTLAQWFYNLAHNKLTTVTQNSLFAAVALYLVFGLIWALLYVRLFEPLMHGPGWREGLVFSLIPFVLSLIVFLPVVGVGPFGADLHAGPLPTIGNFLLHAVYGITLGVVYDQSRQVDGAVDQFDSDTADVDSQTGVVMRSSSRRSAIGILVGIAVGAVIGTILGVNVYSPTTPDAGQSLITGAGELSLAGAVLGASLGALAGSVTALDNFDTENEP